MSVLLDTHILLFYVSVIANALRLRGVRIA